jgi:hypothetical protein
MLNEASSKRSTTLSWKGFCVGEGSVVRIYNALIAHEVLCTMSDAVGEREVVATDAAIVLDHVFGWSWLDG